jgi:hypothetical protein
MIETLLGLWVLSDINRILVLRVFHFSKDVFVSFPFEEVVTNFPMTIISSIMERGPLSEVLSINIAFIS